MGKSHKLKGAKGSQAEGQMCGKVQVIVHVIEISEVCLVSGYMETTGDVPGMKILSSRAFPNLSFRTGQGRRRSKDLLQLCSGEEIDLAYT